MKLRALSVVIVCMMGLPGPSALAQGIPCSYEVAHVIQAPDGPFGASPTGATAISPNGRYVCGSFNPGGIGFDRAFVYDTATEQFIILPLPPGGYQSGCNAVNDAGLAVGSYWVSGGVQPQRGFVYDTAAGQYVAELLPLPGASWCVVTGINSSNTLCGWRSIGSKGDPVNPQTAFIWTARNGGTFTDLGLIDGYPTAAYAINDVGQTVVADAWVAGALALLWDGRTQSPVGPMPDGSTAFVRCVNASDAVAGAATHLPVGPSQPFFWHEGNVQLLGTLPGYNRGGVGAINAHFVVTGLNAVGGTGNLRAFVWQGGLLRDLNALITEPFFLSRGKDIDEQGVIVADAQSLTRNDVVAVVLQPVFADAGDTDCNRQVDIDDLLRVISQWGPCPGCAGDLTGDDVVNLFDLLEVISNWV